MNYEERYSAYQQAIEAYLESIFSAEDKPAIVKEPAVSRADNVHIF